MSEHLSDQEQIQLFKKWWKEYGILLVISLCVCLSGSYAWRYWQQYQAGQSAIASSTYSEILALMGEKKNDEANILIGSLQKDYKRTSYASLAVLMAAKEAVQSSKLVEAEKKLQWILDNCKYNSLRQIARVRLARVLLADKKNDQALEVLNKIDDTALSAEVFEIRGDSLLASGNKTEAGRAYQEAMEINKKNGTESPLLQIKIQDAFN